MEAPPPKPKKESPEGLAEVERALSVLQGRHPEHERVRREEEERRTQRRAEIDAAAAVESRRLLLRRLAIAGGTAVVLGIAVFAAVVFRRELARRGRLEQVADPYRAMGFVLVDSSGRSSPAKIEANVAAGCLLVASASPRVRLAYAGGTVEGPSPLFTCLCEGGHVTAGAERPDGLVLLRGDASAFGGARAAAFLPFKPGMVGDTDQGCADASLDAWLDAKRWEGESASAVRPVAPVDASTSDQWLAAAAKRAVLKNAGFAVTALVKEGAPFAVVDVPAATCALLVPERPTDKVAVRLRGGSFALPPLAAGPAGWCTSTANGVLVQRGTSPSSPPAGGEVAVLFAPAARVGGLAGLRELADQAGLSLAASVVAPADHGWNAKQLLVASAVPESLVTIANAPDIAPDAEARIVGLSSDRPSTLSADAPDGVFSYCDPPLASATLSLCVFSGAHKWRVDGNDVAAGLARAKLPFWLFAFQTVNEPAALMIETQLVGLARRLRRDGFEPTTIAAVTELDTGAEVLGRANEDAMVVLGLAPAPPWVLPYTDGPAWSIDGAPRVIPIAPLERKVVVTTMKKPPPKATRRTVVFRRQKR